MGIYVLNAAPRYQSRSASPLAPEEEVGLLSRQGYNAESSDILGSGEPAGVTPRAMEVSRGPDNAFGCSAPRGWGA
jgi:hypothetical protein